MNNKMCIFITSCCLGHVHSRNRLSVDSTAVILSVSIYKLVFIMYKSTYVFRLISRSNDSC